MLEDGLLLALAHINLALFQTLSCHYAHAHYSSLFRTNSSYCNITKDTVELQCYVNTSKLIFK